MSDFHGRGAELAILDRELERVSDTGRGSFVVVKGRRRVGKSHLLAEFRARRGLRGVSFLASRLRPGVELERFATALAASDAPAAPSAVALRFDTWESALITAATGATRAQPVLIVLDEFPYLVDGDLAGSVEGSVNAAWERGLQHLPMMLVVAGSDLSVMRSVTDHGRPLFDRPTRTLTIDPLTVREVADATGLAGAAAIDAYHVIGGFPRLASLWRADQPMPTFLAHALVDEDDPFVATGQRILDGELPDQVQARTVLSVIGAGERTYGSIARRANVEGSNLRRSLLLLEAHKRLVAVDRPAVGRSAESRYRIADEYLRFHLRFVDPYRSDLVSGRPDLLVKRVERDWQAHIGVAVEPFVRRSLERLAVAGQLLGAERVGSYWTRTNDPQVDLVGTDLDAGRVAFVGSIKWRATERFGPDDLDALRAAAILHRDRVPGAGPGTPLVAVSRTGFESTHGLALALTAEDLLAAW